MCSAKQPEYFFDRSLGKASAARLRESGWIIHLIADFYQDDATRIPDEEWIAEGCSRGWLLLTKDKRIRYRERELSALDAAISSASLQGILIWTRWPGVLSMPKTRCLPPPVALASVSGTCMQEAGSRRCGLDPHFLPRFRQR